MRHAVLAQISLCYSPLWGRLLTRYSPVRHFPLLQLAEASIQRFSFDLHVLSTPPAFILSQDQTLNEWYLNNLSVVQIIIIETNLSFKIELSVPFTNITFDIHEGLPLSFWCFVRFTLFNLQGTHRICDGFLSLPQAFLFVKHFFEFFQTFSSTFIRTAHSRQAQLVYHVVSHLSSTFF